MWITRPVVFLAFLALGTATIYDNLHRQLLKMEDHSIPMDHIDEPLNVSIFLTLTEIKHVDTHTGILDFVGWTALEWHDGRLKWSDNNLIDENLQEISISAKEIWTPDLHLKNGLAHVEEEMHLDALVKRDGTVIFIAPESITTKCNLKHFKDNGNIECELTFGSWTQDIHHLDLHPLAAGWSSRIVSEDWNITTHHVHSHHSHYACCPDTYSEVTFDFVLHHLAKDGVHQSGGHSSSSSSSSSEEHSSGSSSSSGSSGSSSSSSSSGSSGSSSSSSSSEEHHSSSSSSSGSSSSSEEHHSGSSSSSSSSGSSSSSEEHHSQGKSGCMMMSKGSQTEHPHPNKTQDAEEHHVVEHKE